MKGSMGISYLKDTGPDGDGEDDAVWRADPAQVAAEAAAARAAWLFGLIPVGLALVLLGILSGIPLGTLSAIYCTGGLAGIVAMPLWHRWSSPLPRDAGEYGLLDGGTKRRALVWAACGMLIALGVYGFGFDYLDMRMQGLGGLLSGGWC